MTESGNAETGVRTHGRPIVLVLSVLWVCLGFSAVEDGEMWRAAAGVALGLAFLATWYWPDSAFTRWMDKPVFRRKK